jgi:hypothetical protein
MTLTHGDTAARAVAVPVLPGLPTSVDATDVVVQMVRRAASPGFESWWRKAENVGFCANPIHLSSTDIFGRQHQVWTRCNNRRAVACPSCSDLYARDTWQLVHAGLHGGHHHMPSTIGEHPQVFVTLTAPGFGPVHTTRDDTHNSHGRRCHDPGRSGYRRCRHGKPLWCSTIHGDNDARVGQPLCEDCYDYTGHVLFAWHAPELWRRFTITLRRLLDSHQRAMGEAATSVRLNYVKSPRCSAAPSRTFTPSSAWMHHPRRASRPRRVGIRRLSPLAVAELDVTAHVRAILTTITDMAAHRSYDGMDRWLHTLGIGGTSRPNPGCFPPPWAPCGRTEPLGPANNRPTKPQLRTRNVVGRHALVMRSNGNSIGSGCAVSASVP